MQHPHSRSRIQQKLDSVIDFIERKNGTTVSKTDLCHGMYHMNKLIFDLYTVSKSSLSKPEKIYHIMQFRDPDGNIFISEDMASDILSKYSPSVVYLYGELFKLKRDMHEQHNQAHIQRGGTLDPSSILSSVGNTFSSVAQDAGKTISGIPKLLDDITVFLDQLLHDESTFNRTEILPNLRVILNWIFFPLWSLENIPYVGPFIEAPLDLIGIVLDNVDIVMGVLGPTIFEALAIVLNAVQSIPVVGTVVGAVWLQIAPMKKPLEMLTTNGLDILSLFINLTRKQYAQAYFSALNGIPVFSEVIDSLVNVLSVINKYLSRINAHADKVNEIARYINTVFTVVTDNVSTFLPVFGVLLQDPSIFMHPVRFIRRIIIPNKHAIPFLNNFQAEELNHYVSLLEPYLELFKRNPYLYISDINRLYQDIIEPWTKSIPQFAHYNRNQVLGYLYFFLNMSLNYVNPMVQSARNSLQMISNTPYAAPNFTHPTGLLQL